MVKDTIISLDNVSLSLPGPGGKTVHILQEISLQVQAGETISVVGPSGSGKTSLLMLLAGVERASGGRLEVCGRDITHLSEDELAGFRQEQVGIVFQNFHLIPTMRAVENVAVALEFAGYDDSAQRARDQLASVGLAERMDHYPDQLSGGEQQRVALARAFATQPQLLLADEPTGNLDSENGHKIMNMLFELQEKHGTTLMLITHDKELAARASRHLLMKDGRLQDA